MRTKTWGLDMGATGIKAVEVTRTLRGYRVTHYGFFPFTGKGKADPKAETLVRLGEVRSKLGGRGDDLLVSFPSHLTMVHSLALPFQERKKNQQVVKYEVEPLLPFGADQVVADFHSPERNSGEKRSLVFAVRKTDLGGKLSALQEAGLDPESVVPEGLALFWLARSLGKTSGAWGALLDLGEEKSTLLLWRDGQLARVRSVPPASGPPASGAGSGLERVAEEVNRTLLSVEAGAEGGPGGEIFLTGGGSRVPGVERKLSELLQKPVSPLEGEGSPLWGPEVPEEIRPVLSAALGAALGGFLPDRANLRREEFASPQRAKRTRGRLRLLLSYAAVLTLLGVAAFSLNLYLQERRYRDLKGEIRKEFTQALPEVKRVVNEVQQLRARVQEEKAKAGSLGGGPGGGSPLEILRELSLMVEPAAKVRVTELTLDPETVAVNGEADSFDTVNRLKARLDKSGRFKDVQLKTARASSLENVIEFKLTMKRGT